jgi:hypothetical protein
MQHDEAMDHGPEDLAELLRIARKEAGLDQLRHIVGHGAARPRAGALEIGIAAVLLRQVEHQTIGAGLVEGEVEIGAADRVGALGGVALDLGGILERGGEAVEGRRPHRRQNLVLVLEITVGGHRADPQFPRQFAHRHRLRPMRGEQPLGHGAGPHTKGRDLDR